MPGRAREAGVAARVPPDPTTTPLLPPTGRRRAAAAASAAGTATACRLARSLSDVLTP